jgi:hypothetical protein
MFIRLTLLAALLAACSAPPTGTAPVSTAIRPTLTTTTAAASPLAPTASPTTSLLPTDAPPILPTPTPLAPLALTIGDFNCIATPSATALCFGEFTNHTAQPIVNLAVQVTLDEQTATAYSPLDLIPPGMTIPMSAMFPAGKAGRARAVVTQADSGAGLADRFAMLAVNGLDGSTNGGFTLIGAVFNPGPLEVKSVAVVAAVYNSSGAVAGYRKIVLPDPIPSNASAPFAIALPGVVGDAARWTVVAQGRTR